MVSCDDGWVDGDGIIATGCECQLESPEPGNTCSASQNLGDLPDSGGRVPTLHGKIAPVGDEDWYVVNAIDLPDSTGDGFNFDIRFASGGNPGGVFRMDVYRGACGAAHTPPCNTNIPDRYSWYTDFTDGSGTTRLGENPCRSSVTDGFNLCQDNGSLFYLRVYRNTGAAADCAEYAIEITNGVY